MSGIVCAIRGGPESQATIDRAIEVARESGRSLFFLYVVNLDFLAHTSSSRTRTISEQMEKMGEFILLAAQARASQQGVPAEGVIRHGNVREEIAGLCHEIIADCLVLGRPQAEREANVFTEEQLGCFVQQTEEETGAQVVMVEECP